MMVEPVKTKLNAYHFDGKIESAREALDKWPCEIVSINNSDFYKIIFKDGSEAIPGNYIVIKEGIPVVYSQSEFITRYTVVYDIRDRLFPYMLLD